jgi:transketolase
VIIKTQSTTKLAHKIKRLSLEMVHRASSSHIGGVLSSADIIAVLYGSVMNFKPVYPLDESRDRFILSKGHCCVGVYAALASVGFFNVERLKEFTVFGSIFMSHISHKVPGVEFSTGSLGHGLPFGVGKAYLLKKNRPGTRVFVLLSDGELGEGSNLEALIAAAHFQLDNLIIIIDKNNLQSLGATQETMNLDPLAPKFESFGLETLECDGHNHASLIQCLTKEKSKGLPRVVICNTIKGYPISFMKNKVEWHYKSPNTDELAAALDELRDFYAT